MHDCLTMVQGVGQVNMGYNWGGCTEVLRSLLPASCSVPGAAS